MLVIVFQVELLVLYLSIAPPNDPRSLLIAGKQASQVQDRRPLPDHRQRLLLGQPEEAGGDRAAGAEVDRGQRRVPETPQE